MKEHNEGTWQRWKMFVPILDKCKNEEGKQESIYVSCNVIPIYFVYGMKMIANEGCLKTPGASSSTFVVCDVLKTCAYDDVFTNNLIRD